MRPVLARKPLSEGVTGAIRLASPAPTDRFDRTSGAQGSSRAARGGTRAAVSAFREAPEQAIRRCDDCQKPLSCLLLIHILLSSEEAPVNSVRLMAATLLCAMGTACGTEPNPPDNGGGTPPPGPVIPPPGQTTTCTQPTEITLAAGGHTIIDPATNLGCIRIPEAGTAGAEHVVVAMATNGRETSSGGSVTYDLRGTPTLLGQVAATADAPLPRELDPRIGKFAGRLKRDEFHKLLRAKERVLSKYAVPSFNRSPTAFSAAAVPPQVGDQRTFKVCSTEQCTSFVDVTATVRHVGPKGAIYLDD